jgi:hypothetical protein
MFVCTALFPCLLTLPTGEIIIAKQHQVISIRICQISANYAGIYGGPRATQCMQCSEST